MLRVMQGTHRTFTDIPNQLLDDYPATFRQFVHVGASCPPANAFNRSGARSILKRKEVSLFLRQLLDDNDLSIVTAVDNDRPGRACPDHKAGNFCVFAANNCNR